MEFTNEFTPLTVEELPQVALERKREGWRFVQILAVNTDDGVDLIYSFMSSWGLLRNYRISSVRKGTVVQSISDKFFAAFVFENEVHDLFGVEIKDIAIDFGGNFYQLAQAEPMTIISPAQKAAREKAAKLEAAKRAKAAKAAEAAYAAAHPEVAKPRITKPGGIAPSDDDELEKKMAGVDPEKVARVKAAIAAKAKKAEEEAAVKQAAREEKIANLDPEKAARVKAALEAKAKKAECQRASGSTNAQKDAELEAKLAQLDPEKAAKVRAALDAQARKKKAAETSGKDGE